MSPATVEHIAAMYSLIALGMVFVYFLLGLTGKK